MNDKHKIEIYLTCEQFELVNEAAQFVGCNDLEHYIISIIMDRC